MLFGQYIVALCIPRIHEGNNHKFIAALSQSLIRRGCHLMVFSTPSDLFWNSVDEQGEKTVFELINYDVTDAVIIHDEAIKDKELVRSVIRRSHEHNIPVVTVGGSYEGCAGIKFNYTAGFEKIVRHVLKDHKVTDFHFIAGIKGNDFSDERISIVRKVAEELDIPFSDEDVSYGEFWSKPTEMAVEVLFKRRRILPQAIICANDTMAITTVNILKKHGVKVPDDIMVTGFDGIDDINYCSPRITSCLCSSEQMAECVAETARRMINGDTMPELQLVVPDLQKSESCGCKSSVEINASAELTYVNNSFFRYQSEEEHMFRMMSKMLGCGNFTEISELISKYDFYNMIIAVNPECLDSTVNPLNKISDTGFGDTVKLVYNASFPTDHNIHDLKTVDLHPDMMDIITKGSEPVIFLSLNYMGITMGYLAFNFHNYDIQNYYKASQIVNTLNAAFGAYRTVQYQHYLSEKIEEMYRCDGLTHLLNRLALKNSYSEVLSKCDGKMTVILADLDGLKFINDNYGHDDGDFAICTLANAMKSCCPDYALCVRWGGDEMVAVIPGEHSTDGIHEEIERYISGVNSISGKSYAISASVGIKSFDVDSSTKFEDMVRTTDQLMYSEKKRKKHKAVV